MIIVKNSKDNLKEQLIFCACQYGSIHVMQFYNPINNKVSLADI